MHIIHTRHVDTHGVSRLLCFESPLICFLLLVSLISFPFLSQMPHMHTWFSAVQSSWAATKGECRKRLCMTGRPGQGQRMEPIAPEHWWPGARGPAGSHPSTWKPTCLPLHSVSSGWFYATCPHSHTGTPGTVNHWINGHYLCILSRRWYLRRQPDTLGSIEELLVFLARVSARCLCPLFGTDSEWWPLFVFFLLTYNAWPSHKCRHDPFSWQRHEAPPYCMSDVIPNCIHKKSKNRPQQTIFTIYSDAESLLPHTLSECTIKMLPASV